jgi:Gpi18-like mannosyltransferase
MCVVAMSAHQRIEAAPVTATRAGIGWPLGFAVVAAAALYFYCLCWATVPPDMTLFLFPWYDHILEHGPVGAFAQPFSNYTPPYLYLLAAASLAKGVLAPLGVIKALSVAGTAFLAFAVADLLKALGADARRAVLVFVLPTLLLNAALLGQCDALWTGACVFATAAMIRGRTVAALIWCGVAIAFKAQAAFLAPFIIGALIGRRAPPWQWVIPPAVFAAAMLPAWLAGWPASNLALIYLRQVEHFDFPGNLANPWLWGTEFAPGAAQSVYWLGYAGASATAIALAALTANAVRKPRAMMLLALLSSLALPFLLPKMHERYLFLADVLALALALAARTRTTAVIAVAVQLTSLSALASYIYNWATPALAGSAIGAIALFAICQEARAGGVRWPAITSRAALPRPASAG